MPGRNFPPAVGNSGSEGETTMRRLNPLHPLSTMFCRRPELRPARALLTATWVFALALLAVNDHVLKGAGVLPGALTGKLSDFAGMIVAPVLLAVLLRVRSRRGLLLCHAAVGAVFAGINVSPALAAAWTRLMAPIWPWHITVDPTDLVAIPALALGWRALVPAMTRPASTLAPWLPAAAQASAVAVGGFLCVATSDDTGEPWMDDTGVTGEDGGDTDYEDLTADVYLHNAGNADIRVRTRPLRPEVQLDCSGVDEAPGVLLAESLFGEGQTVLLPPSTNTAVRDMADVRDCYAVRVEGDTFAAPFVLFWRASQIPATTIDGDIDDPLQHTQGAVLLATDADDRVFVEASRRPIVFPIEAPPADAFVPGDDGSRLTWSDPPLGDHRLAGVELGPDGCLAVTVDDAPTRWYLCAPEGAFPFVAEQWVHIEKQADALEIRGIVGPQDPVPAPAVQLTLARGAALPTISGLSLAADTDFSAALAPEPVCGTVSRPATITARPEGGEVAHIDAGASMAIEVPDGTLTLWVAHAEQRVVLDPTCAEGPDGLGADLEVIALFVADEP